MNSTSTPTLQIKCEWQDAPGVKDDLLRNSWARLEIWIDNKCATQVIDSELGTTQEGVFGSIFPLAKWMVENWWALFCEQIRHPHHISGRKLVRQDSVGWFRRHNFLCAREGMPLPDINVSRWGPSMLVSWFSDPDEMEGYPIHFCSYGQRILPIEDTQRELRRLVEMTLRKLEGSQSPEYAYVMRNWDAIKTIKKEEFILCDRAARIGLDPYDADELTDDLAEVLCKDISNIPKGIRDDLLDALLPTDVLVVVPRLREAQDMIRRHLGSRVDIPSTNTLIPAPRASTHLPYEIGFELANLTRERIFSIGQEQPLPNLADVVAERLHWPIDEQSGDFDFKTKQLTGIVGVSDCGAPIILGPTINNLSGQNFRLARGLCTLLRNCGRHSARLLTTSHVPSQQIGRSFAAQLLAPRSALRNLVSSQRISFEEVVQLAEHFGVDTMVISNQLKNGSIARIESD